MKHTLIAFATAGLIGLSLVGSAAAAPPGVEFRDAPNAGSKADCVGVASASAKHNGQAGTLGQGGDPSHGTRGDEIKAIHAACD